MHLILDLDGTLIYCEDERDHKIKTRPFLAEFIRFCFQHCETVSIWSAGSPQYVKMIVEHILQPMVPDGHFFIIRNRDMTHISYHHDHIRVEKRLKRLWKSRKCRDRGMRPHNTIIVDDNPEVCTRNYGNAIYVEPYRGDDPDFTLLILKEYLLYILDRDVRSIEKRYWLWLEPQIPIFGLLTLPAG